MPDVLGCCVGWSRERSLILFRGWNICVYGCHFIVGHQSFLCLWCADDGGLIPPCRGEMSAMYPVSGAFSVFGTRFVSPALGFTLGEYYPRIARFNNPLICRELVGWNYWFQWFVKFYNRWILFLMLAMIASVGAYQYVSTRALSDIQKNCLTCRQLAN